MPHTRIARIALVVVTAGIPAWLSAVDAVAFATSQCARTGAASTGIGDCDGRVAGRVVDSRGAPVAGLPLDLVLAAERDVRGGSDKRVSVWTAADGTFELQGVPQGDYVLGFNATRNHDGRLILPRAFYPGVVDATAAGMIGVAAGERVQLPDFVVPQEIRFATATGVVVDVDGRLVAGATLTLRDNSEGPNIIGREFRTKEDGRFSFSVVLGARYELQVSRRVNADPPHVSTRYFTASASAPTMTVILKPPPR